jgi:uncharacterized protein
MSMVRVFLGLLLAGAGLPFVAEAYASPGSPDGYVTDFAGILSAETESIFETELAAYEASTTIEIAVVTISSLEGDDIASYSNELGREWGVGQEGADNGVLLLIAPNDRTVRIEVGYGLEGAIPDVTAGRIIDELMLPAFREGDYEAGIVAGVGAIEALGNGEVFPESTPGENDGFDIVALSAFVLIFGLNVLSAFAAILARSKSWWLGGVVGVLGGGILGFVFGSLYGALAVAITLGVIGALFDYIVSKNYRGYKNGGSTPPWYFGGGGRGSSGDGGFGGGSFGGGGASRSW